MNTPKELSYSKSHEWVKYSDDNTALIGISDYAQHELGGIVFVNLPELGAEVKIGDTIADIESVKVVSDIYAPLEGKISRINEELEDSPEKINEDPYAAWLFEVSDITAKEKLITADEYDAFCEEGE